MARASNLVIAVAATFMRLKQRRCVARRMCTGVEGCILVIGYVFFGIGFNLSL